MRLIRLLIIMVLSVPSQVIWAHAEHDKARFIAPDGNDEGRCDNRFRPCKTLLYAATHANKGDTILVAQGDYLISDESEIYYLTSQLVPVLGGYSRIDNYNVQNPSLFATRLIGLPFEFASDMQKQGFAVLADTKSRNINHQKLAAKFATDNQLKQAQQDVACTNGSAGAFPCHNMSLVAHVPIEQFSGSHYAANDIWGHIDLNNGTEYALIGLSHGVGVVSLANPSAPQVVGSVSGFSSDWRDIKVYQYYSAAEGRWRAYAYVTSETRGDGVSIIDLNHLPESVTLASNDFAFATAHNVYISGVDYSLNIANSGFPPLLQILGANRLSGSQHSYSLTDPTDLSDEMIPSGQTRSDYTHDASSFVTRDSAQTAQCNNATENGCLVLLDFNEDEIRLWDQSKLTRRSNLSRTTYSNAAYVHSGWWSEDQQFIFVHDELDEMQFGLNTTLRIFDISDLHSPQLAGTWTGPTAAIDHNGFVRGNRYYMSNYERGVTVLDISNPASPEQIGYFDTFPSSDNSSFNGAWGVYPFLPSGLILVSDIGSGLYILKDETLNPADDTLSFSDNHLTSEEGEQITLSVNRSGNSSQAATVNYETLTGSATDNDFSAQQGTLSWAAGDTSPKTITLTITPDQNDTELNESFFVRLYQPSSKTQLGSNKLVNVTIAGKTATNSASFTQNELTLYENGSAQTITVARQGNVAEAFSVDYQLTAQTADIGADIQGIEGTLTWQANDLAPKTLTLTPIDDSDVESDETLLLTLSAANQDLLGNPHEVVITIKDDESNHAPSVNAGNNQQVNALQRVELVASATDEDGDNLTYSWLQTSGVIVNLRDKDTLTAIFTAPNNNADLTFELTATDPFGALSKSSVSIKVVKSDASGGTSSAGDSGGSVNWFGLLLLATLCAWRQNQLTNLRRDSRSN
ncbi:choice-of-anchor B family protein [Neptunicella marina]|uniref:Choice-of-anchor B family protein n=1 Tax=Neptunicella marina TaxID=2125989 RepID=A0A8J6LZU8_9ALTE|nr:choice-of-anchor B family protein [Neptunicella marina]MBC3766460.1 choice-of-anchor B family protein [Neptunicella marina]